MNKTLWSSVMAALMLVACGKKEEAPAPAAAPAAPAVAANAEEKILNIYNWPDYVPEGMIAAFEKETGIKVNYDTFETNEALNAKLVAGNTGYDIVVPGTTFSPAQTEAGFFQPLQKDKLKNYVNLDPAIMMGLQKADPENKHLVPWAWSFTTVGINRAKVEKALGKLPMPENAWDLVFKPEYTSKLKSCGIAYLDSPTEVFPPALHYIGKEAYSNDAADHKEAAAMLAKVRKDVRIFSSTMIDDIAGGKACVALGWSGDINIAAGRAKENGSKDTIEALLPSTGGLIFYDTMAITKDAKHPNNAHAFIDYYLRAESGAKMADEMSYSTGNKAALEKMKPEVAGNKTIFVDSEFAKKMVAPGKLTNEGRESMANAYTAFKKGK
jgi:putrescine transport system substrate-binding protein